MSERLRTHCLRLLEDDSPGVPPSLAALALEIEERDSNGHVIVPEPNYGLSYDPDARNGTVPPAEVLQSGEYQTFTVQAGEVVELRIQFLLTKLMRSKQGVRPGTYALRATVSYAEAPSGQKKTVSSEPVTITITDGHIKAADAYQEAYAKVRDGILTAPAPHDVKP